MAEVIESLVDWIKDARERFSDWIFEALPFLGLLVVIVTVLAIVWLAVESTPLIRNDDIAECLRRGYTNAYVVSEDGERMVYCSRLESGTEVVVPITNE